MRILFSLFENIKLKVPSLTCRYSVHKNKNTMIRTDVKVDNTEKIFFPPAEKNKTPILEVLQAFIKPDERANLLEVSSGTGQHVVFFARHFPNVIFQPSDYDPVLLPSIQGYLDDENKLIGDNKSLNILPPLSIDASELLWPALSNHNNHFHYLLNVNLIHVSPYACTIGLFTNAARLLRSGGLMFTYGAYMKDGRIEPESNVEFDKLIRSKNEEWGLRDLTVLEELAGDHGIKLSEVRDMPSNNKCCVWRKE